jgi:rod shape-determining protein MreB
VKGQGIVLNEPSVVAVRKGTNKVLNDGKAVGIAAKEMLGKTPGTISAIRPLKEGVISDFEITEAMLAYFIRKVNGPNRFFGPRVVISIPGSITNVEKRAVLDSAERAGARRVYLVEEPMAAGIGAGLPIGDPTASMIVDIGGGTTDVAIISLGDTAKCKSARVAGDDFDEAIVDHMRNVHGLLIGEQSAERVKIEIGSAGPLAQELEMEVRGRDNVSGMPRKAVINSVEIREALATPVRDIIKVCKDTLEEADPELAADLVNNGIVLAGGGALLRNIDRVISQATGLETRVANDPLTCVALGTSMFLENLEAYKELLESDVVDF